MNCAPSEVPFPSHGLPLLKSPNTVTDIVGAVLEGKPSSVTVPTLKVLRAAIRSSTSERSTLLLSFLTFNDWSFLPHLNPTIKNPFTSNYPLYQTTSSDGVFAVRIYSKKYAYIEQNTSDCRSIESQMMRKCPPKLALLQGGGEILPAHP